MAARTPTWAMATVAASIALMLAVVVITRVRNNPEPRPSRGVAPVEKTPAARSAQRPAEVRSDPVPIPAPEATPPALAPRATPLATPIALTAADGQTSGTTATLGHGGHSSSTGATRGGLGAPGAALNAQQEAERIAALLDGKFPAAGTDPNKLNSDFSGRNQLTQAVGGQRIGVSTGGGSVTVPTPSPTPYPEPEPGEAVIGGTVKRGGQPVAQANLRLNGGALGNSTAYATTDETGVYRFAPVDPGTYTILLASPSSPSPTRVVTAEEDARLLTEDFNIPALPPVRGKVVDDYESTPIGGARLTVFSGSRQLGSVSGDANGDFELFALEPGSYLLKATANAYRPGEKTFEVLDEGETPALEVRLEPSTGVSGTVFLPSGGPASGASVGLFRLGSSFNDPYAASGSQLTPGDGSFRFDSLPSGATEKFRVGAVKSGNVPAFSAEIFDPADAATFDRAAAVRLQAGARVTGSVVDSDGAPIPDALVEVSAGFANTGAIFTRMNIAYPSMRTAANGRFDLIGVEEGAFTLRVSAEGFTSLEEDFSTAGAATDVGALTLDSVDSPKPGRIFGTIVDERGTGVNAQNVYVKCLNCGSPADALKLTDSTGSFLFDNLPDGIYGIFTNGHILRPEVFMQVNQVYTGPVPGGERVVLVYDLGQSIKMRVLGANGEPAGRVRIGIYVEDVTGASAFGTGDKLEMQYEQELNTSEGNVTVRHLLAGVARLNVSIPGAGSRDFPNLRIAPGQQLDLGDITVDSGITILGSVMKTEGGGLGGATVRAVPPGAAGPNHPLNTTNYSAVSSSDGSFRIAGVPEVESLDILVTAPNRVTTRATGFVPSGTTLDVREIAVPLAATVSGVVRNDAGAGIAGILIRGEGVEVYTDPQGFFESNTATPGENRIFQFSDPQGRYRRAEATVESLPPGGRSELNLVLAPSGS